MLLASALSALLTAAAPGGGAQPLPGLVPVNVSIAEAELYGEILSARLSERGLKVISGRDVRTLLGLERQKALLGCSETSCLAELSGALGVDGVLVGFEAVGGGIYALPRATNGGREPLFAISTTGHRPAVAADRSDYAVAFVNDATSNNLVFTTVTCAP